MEYKDYLITIEKNPYTGMITASAMGDNDYFTRRFMWYTKKEIIAEMKALIRERATP